MKPTRKNNESEKELDNYENSSESEEEEYNESKKELDNYEDSNESKEEEKNKINPQIENIIQPKEPNRPQIGKRNPRNLSRKNSDAIPTVIIKIPRKKNPIQNRNIPLPEINKDKSKNIPLPEINKDKSKNIPLEKIKNDKNENIEPIQDDMEDYGQYGFFSDENQSKIEHSLLKTINYIGKYNFEDMSETYMNDCIPKFVMNFFEISSIKDVEISPRRKFNIGLNKSELKNINAVIEFLKLKSNKFKTLLFNFRHPLFIVSSVFLFYTNFLDIFFVKYTQKQMLEKCLTLINPKNKHNNYNNYDVFYDIGTFAHLAFLMIKNKYYNKSFNNLLKTIDLNTIFVTYLHIINVPIIIDEEILTICKERHNLSIIFYQLQFIFDYFDSKPSLKIISILYNGYLNIKLPPFKEIAASIKVKNASILMQVQRFEQYQIQKQKSGIKDEDESNTINEGENTSENCISLRLLSSKNYQDDDTFCNNQEEKFEYLSGILFNKENFENRKQNDSQNWNSAINQIKKITKTNKKDIMAGLNLQRDNPTTTLDVIKLFYYDEKIDEWKFNIKSFYNFIEQNGYKKKMKTPLIYFSNSFENDLVNTMIMCQFSKSKPIFDEKTIYIYGLGDYSNTLSIKPIFLLLHVPKSKINLPNLRTIITQIDCFLTFICDIKIILFNELYYNEQVAFEQSIKKITRSNTIFKDDDDEHINIIKIMISKKKPIFFALFNCKEYNNRFEQNFKYNPFFINIKDQIGYEINKMHCIYSRNKNSYKLFESDLQDSMKLEGNTCFEQLEEKFTAIDLSKMSRMYIYLKNKDDWETKLEKVINNKFNIIKSTSTDPDNNRNILSILKIEIQQLYPHFDYIFKNKCDKIFKDIVKKTSENYGIMIIELKKISQNNIEHLKQVINNKCEIADDEKYDIIQSHVQYLEEEFFEIYKKFYLSDDINVFNECQYYLNQQINKDKNDLNILIQKSAENNKKKLKKKRDLNSGTNYTLREIEHKKEIKITINVDSDLRDKIEQDF